MYITFFVFSLSRYTVISLLRKGEDFAKKLEFSTLISFHCDRSDGAVGEGGGEEVARVNLLGFGDGFSVDAGDAETELEQVVWAGTADLLFAQGDAVLLVGEEGLGGTVGAVGDEFQTAGACVQLVGNLRGGGCE